MLNKNTEKPTQIIKTLLDDSKVYKSGLKGRNRARKKMKEFCSNLLAFEHPIQICDRFKDEITHSTERDTKRYFMALSRELFDLIGLFGSLMSEEGIKEGIELSVILVEEK